MLRDHHCVRYRITGEVFRFSKTLLDIQYESLNYDGTANYTLAYLCCKVITSDGHFAQQSLRYLPPTIYKLLMSVALMNGRDRAIQILLTVWPWPTLILSDLIPPFHDSIDVLYDINNCRKWLENSFFITSSLINGFISCLCTDTKLTLAKLKILDLGGFPTDDTIVCKVAKIILSSCENFHKSCHPKCRKYAREDFGHNSSMGYQLLTLDMNSVLEEKTNTFLYTIRVDSAIYTKETFETLFKLFTSKTLIHSPLRLQFSKIDLSSCNGNRNIMQLLSSAELQSMPLRGLSLSCNHLMNGGVFEMLIVSVLPFRYIESLDISYNRINLTYDATLLETFSNALSSLNHLKRLNLSNNRLNGCLTSILSKLSNIYVERYSEPISFAKSQRRRTFSVEEPSCGLEYLNISACKLSETDIIYLSQSHHIATLKELDISQNNMCLFVESVIKLLRALKTSIYILDIEECYFSEEQLCNLLPEFYGFSNLKYLNYAGHPVSSKNTYSHLESLLKVPNLVLVQISYPVDYCADYRTHRYNAVINVDEERRIFKEKCQLLLSNEQSGECQLNVIWS